MGIYGQDWASYQGSTPSTKDLDFVFIKVTEGTSYESPVWKSQVADARAAKIAVGYYHYPHMHNKPDSEVNYFLSKVTPAVGDLIVLDWEGYDVNNRNISPSEQLSYKDEYLRFMKSKFPHNPVGLYCNTDYWLRIDKASHAGDFLWIATANKPAGQPGISYPWKFHQYGSSGVDKDYANFTDRASLVTWARSFAPQPPVPPTHKEPTIHLEFVVRAARTDPTAPQGHKTFPFEVGVVENALVVEKLLNRRYAKDGSFGTKTIDAYKEWQKKLGYSGIDANGIPGMTSLKTLGSRHGFHVI